MAFSFSFTSAIALLGSSLNSSLTPRLFDRSQSFFLPLFVSVIFLFISGVCAIGHIYIDKVYEKHESRTQVYLADIEETSRKGFLQTLNITIYSIFKPIVFSAVSVFSFNKITNHNDKYH